MCITLSVGLLASSSKQMLIVKTIVKRDISFLDTTLLVALDALLTDLNVTRAAHRIGVTQQGLSGQLSRLRHYFGDPLFVRDGAGVAATPYAETLKPLVADALAALRALVETPVFNPAQFDGTLHLVATDYAVALMLPKLLARLHISAPDMKLAVTSGNVTAIETEIRDRKIDLGLIVPQFTPAGLRSRKLFAETYVGAVRTGHPLTQGEITPARFCAFPHLLVSPNKGDFEGPTDKALAAAGWKRNVALVVPGFSVAAELLQESDLVAVLPRRLIKRYEHKIHAFEPPVTIEGFELHAVWPDRLHADAMNRWFRELCFDLAKRIASPAKERQSGESATQ